MRRKSGTGKAPAEQVIKDIRQATRKQYSAEEKIRIVLEGLRGEESIAAQGRALGAYSRAVSAAYDGDVQMIDSSSIRVHQHAANGQKKTNDPVAWVARAAA